MEARSKLQIDADMDIIYHSDEDEKVKKNPHIHNIRSKRGKKAKGKFNKHKFMPK